MPVDWEAYVRDIEENRIPEFQKQLAPLEDGSMHIGTRQAGSDWEDITQKRIAELKATIAMYQGIADRHRGVPRGPKQAPTTSAEGSQILVGQPLTGR